jgi:hypothetical protein
MRLRFLKTPGYVKRVMFEKTEQLTLQDDTVCDNFFDIVLGLREEVENVHNATFDEFRQFILLLV